MRIENHLPKLAIARTISLHFFEGSAGMRGCYCGSGSYDHISCQMVLLLCKIAH